MKRALFKYFGGSDHRGGEVVYIVRGTICVFSATTRYPSSINAVEDIVEAICQSEGCSPAELTFYDLQTHRGYTSRQPGEFAFDRIRLGITNGEIVDPVWSPEPCPPEIVSAFADFIGPNPCQV